MIRFYLTLTFVFVSNLILFAQPKSFTDSLEVLVDTTTQIEVKYQNLKLLAQLNYGKDPKKGLAYSRQFLALVESEANQEELPTAYNMIGLFLNTQDMLDSALYYFDQAKTLWENEGNIKGQAKTWNNIGIIHFNRGVLNEALAAYLKSLTLEESAIPLDSMGVAQSYANVVAVLRQMGELERAKTYLDKLYEMIPNIHDPLFTIQILIQISNYYLDVQDYESVEYYAYKALEFSEENEMSFGKLKALGNITSARIEKKQIEGVKEYLSQEELLVKEYGAAYDIAIFYIKQGKYFVLKGMFDRAYQSYQQALSKIGGTDYLALKIEIYSSLYEMYKENGQYKEALSAHEVYYQFRDSIFNQTKSQQIIELTEKYETEKKEQEIFSLQQANNIQELELAQNRVTIFVMVGVSLVVILVGYLLYRQKQTMHRQRHVELEQKLLRMQMNPHFFFNALGAIQNFMLTEGPQQAARFLSKFAKLMRQILENSREEFITLEQEVDTLNNYLLLQQLRFNDQFSFTVEVDTGGELGEDEVLIPPMFAQPFVENAIEHGIAALEEKGEIKVLLKVEGEQVRITVQDNGVGIEAAVVKKEHKSLSTIITQERIQIFSKSLRNQFSFKLEDAFQDRVHKGTRAIIVLPSRVR